MEAARWKRRTARRSLKNSGGKSIEEENAANDGGRIPFHYENNFHIGNIVNLRFRLV